MMFMSVMEIEQQASGLPMSHGESTEWSIGAMRKSMLEKYLGVKSAS